MEARLDQGPGLNRGERGRVALRSRASEAVAGGLWHSVPCAVPGCVGVARRRSEPRPIVRPQGPDQAPDQAKGEPQEQRQSGDYRIPGPGGRAARGGGTGGISGSAPAHGVPLDSSARVISALDLGARLGQSQSWPQFAHLGANAYGRLTGLDSLFGTSFRFGGFDIDVTDTKPRLTSFYVRPMAGHRFALFGVIESQPFTACVQAVVTPGLSTRMQTVLQLYPRAGYVGPPGAKVSPLALSSMFWKGEAQTPANPADEAHDADTMAVCGPQAVDLQDVVPAFGSPVQVRDFGPADCLGLFQMDRDPTHYQTYAAAGYARRVNLWVEDQESDLPFAVKLMVYGTEYEGEDNVVAYTEFLEDLPTPATATGGTNFSYTLTAAATLPITEARIAFDAAVAGDVVGASVAQSGDTLAVGAPGIPEGPGAVYLFKSTPFGLVATLRLTPNDTVPGDGFGAATALSGGTLVVSAPGVYAVYVFVRQGEDWVQQARLSVFESWWGASFRSQVSLSGDTLVVGVPYADLAAGSSADEGAVHVYRRLGEVWSLEATLIANDHSPWDYFGSAVSLDGNTLAIGAPGDDYPSLWEQGSVYLFGRTGTTWTQTAKLTEAGGWKDYGAPPALAREAIDRGDAYWYPAP